MDRYPKKILTSLTRLAYGLSCKRRPTTDRSPAPQTSLIFKLPDELILSILSHVSPDPRLTGPYAWFCPPDRRIGDAHNRWVDFLRPLSMTCRAMRLRFLPWVWERLALPSCSSEEVFVRRLNAITNASRADKFLATNVKFMRIYLVWSRPIFRPFVKCLDSFPNLHTLLIACADGSITTPLKKALRGVKLPQIKTLIISLNAHPLLQHCRNVEEVVCVFYRYDTMPSDGFLRSLASNRKSKVKRLAIPLVLWANPSQFVAACPRLTELTVISPYTHDSQDAETVILLDQAGRARSAISELVVACKALQNFDTFQIQEQTSRKQTKDMEEWAIDCLEKPETGCREGKGRKKITLRVINFSPGRPCHSFAKIEREL